MIGALLDTRAISEPVTAMSISADIPEQQPVTLTLDSGTDLRSWEPLAQKVLFRPAGAADVLGSGLISFPSVDLSKRYVRVTWQAEPGLSVRIRRAVIRTATSSAPQRIEIPTTSPELVDPHDVRFALGSGSRLDAIRVTPAPGDGVVPVRLFGRRTVEEPWALLGARVLYAPGDRQQSPDSNVVELAGATFRNYRLEADLRTPGFSKPPTLHLIYRPASLIVLFNGSPPFTLAAGSANAANVFLTRSEIIPGENVALSRLPLASVAASGPRVVALAPTAESNRISRRRALLWGILALGAAVLLFATVTLFRKAQSPELLSR